MGCISSPATTAVIALIREFRPSQQIATPCQGASTDSLNLGSIDALPHRLCRNTQETTDRDFDRCTPSRNDITLYLKLAHCSLCGGRLEGPLSVELLSGSALRRASGNVKGFGCRPGTERSPQYKGPSSESLRRRNPREGGDCLAGYGDLTSERV